MKDTNQKTNRLSIAALLFVLILVIGFITISKPEFEYQLSIKGSLEQVLSLKDEMSPNELSKILEKDIDGYVVVDIRNPYEFIKGNIEGSRNIPFQNLLAEENVEFFEQMLKDSVKIVIYGYDQNEANGSWMLLHQLGYSNVKILQGGYAYYSGKIIHKEDESGTALYLPEIPTCNFIEILDKLTDGNVKGNVAEHEIIIPIRKKKKSVVQGGC